MLPALLGLLMSPTLGFSLPNMGRENNHRGLPVREPGVDGTKLGRQAEACETSRVTSSPWASASQTVRRVGGGPGWPQRSPPLLERGGAKSPDGACTLGNAQLWVTRERGTGRATQLSAVLLSSLSRRAVQAAEARDSCRETHEEPRRQRGSRKEEAGRGVARRDPGAEARGV